MRYRVCEKREKTKQYICQVGFSDAVKNCLARTQAHCCSNLYLSLMGFCIDRFPDDNVQL